MFNYDYCEELAHPNLFPNGKFGYKIETDISLSPSKYFNQRFLNYTLQFLSESDFFFYPFSFAKVELELSD